VADRRVIKTVNCLSEEQIKIRLTPLRLYPAFQIRLPVTRKSQPAHRLVSRINPHYVTRKMSNYW